MEVRRAGPSLTSGGKRVTAGWEFFGYATGIHRLGHAISQCKQTAENMVMMNTDL